MIHNHRAVITATVDSNGNAGIRRPLAIYLVCNISTGLLLALNSVLTKSNKVFLNISVRPGFWNTNHTNF